MHQIVVDIVKIVQRYTTVMPERVQQKLITASNYNSRGKKELQVILQSHHLSESKTKCWLSGSWRAFANNRLSASTIEIFPHMTCKNDQATNFINLAAHQSLPH